MCIKNKELNRRKTVSRFQTQHSLTDTEQTSSRSTLINFVLHAQNASASKLQKTAFSARRIIFLYPPWFYARENLYPPWFMLMHVAINDAYVCNVYHVQGG